MKLCFGPIEVSVYDSGQWGLNDIFFFFVFSQIIYHEFELFRRIFGSNVYDIVSILVDGSVLNFSLTKYNSSLNFLA